MDASDRLPAMASSAARAVYGMPAHSVEIMRTHGRDIMRHVRTISRLYLYLRIFATAATLAWAVAYTRALWNSRFDKDRRDRLIAINDLWIGSRSGILFVLVAHWAFTIALLVISPLLGTVMAAIVEYLRVQA